MAELEKMSPEKAKRMTDLIGKIFVAIEVDADYTYQEVMCALDTVKNHYMVQGENLLNNKSIQEVARCGGLLD